MLRHFAFGCALIVALSWPAASIAAEVTITGPVLSVYEDGFRIAEEKAQAMRVFAWTLCGDSTRDHIRRGDQVTVEGDRSADVEPGASPRRRNAGVRRMRLATDAPPLMTSGHARTSGAAVRSELVLLRTHGGRRSEGSGRPRPEKKSTSTC
jgi:hypothetical protein